MRLYLHSIWWTLVLVAPQLNANINGGYHKSTVPRKLCARPMRFFFLLLFLRWFCVKMDIRDLLNAGPTPGLAAQPSLHSTSGLPSQLLSCTPSAPLIDIRSQLVKLTTFLNGNDAIEAPPFIQENLHSVLGYLETRRDSLSSDAPLTIPRTPHDSDSESIMPVKRSTNVKINRITTLEVLYEYPVGYILEYPETSSTGSIGHLFCMDPDDWQDPTLNIAYSRGGNMGQTVSGASVKCDLLVDSTGKRVDCSERHTTCTCT